ncbi:MAG: chromosome segregation protein, partial [Armatimonadetes bacterium]|nr:chromosome segregation protein [Armatimonadota bacterium]
EAGAGPPAEDDASAAEPVAMDTEEAGTPEAASEQADEPEKETAGAPAGDSAGDSGTAESPGVA